MTVAVVFFSSAMKNTVQVFFVPMAESFRVSRGEFAVAVSVFTVFYGLAGPVVGRVSDRIGARRTIAGGVGLAGATFLLTSLLPWLPAFVLLYGVLGAVSFAAMSYVPIGILVDEAFDQRRRGVTYALLTNSAALGFVILSPTWVYLIDRSASWRGVYTGLGLLFLGPLWVLVRRTLPSSVDRTPEPEDDVPVTAIEAPDRRTVTGGLGDMLTSRTFWMLAVGFFGCGVTMAFVDVHMVAHMQHLNLSSTIIGGSLVTLGITEIGGALVAGWLCDHYDKHHVLGGSYLARSFALALLLLMPSSHGAMTFAAVFGLSYMGSVIATTFIALDSFGSGNKGLAIGLIWMVHQLGAFLSTQLGATSYDALGSYQVLIVGTALVAMTSAAASAFGLPRSRGDAVIPSAEATHPRGGT